MLAATLLAVFTSSPMANFAIWVIIFVTVVGLVMIFLRVAGYNPPQWFFQAVGLVVAAVIIIALIVFLVEFAGSPRPMIGS